MLDKQAQKRHWSNRLVYHVLRQLVRLICIVLYRVRVFGRENFPHEGGLLILANHQSNLDPPLVGMTCNRRMNFLAKKQLFEHQPFKWWIQMLDAIPIDREGMGLAGIRETLRRLKRGEIVLVFPEGQRTFDGEMNRLMPGFCAFARRSKVPLLPIGFDGAFQAWTRGTRFPKLGTIVIVVGQAIPVAEYQDLDDRELIDLVDARIKDCFEQARAARKHLLNGSVSLPPKPDNKIGDRNIQSSE